MKMMTLSRMFDHSPSVLVNAPCVSPMPLSAVARSGTDTRMMNAVIEQTRNVSK